VILKDTTRRTAIAVQRARHGLYILRLCAYNDSQKAILEMSVEPATNKQQASMRDACRPTKPILLIALNYHFRKSQFASIEEVLLNH